MCWETGMLWGLQENEGPPKLLKIDFNREMSFQPTFVLRHFQIYTFLIYASPTSPLSFPLFPNNATPLYPLYLLVTTNWTQWVPPAGVWATFRQLHFWRKLTLPPPTAISCQELFSLEVGAHKTLPHSSWNYGPLWTCAGNHSCCEFVSTTFTSCPEDSTSQDSSQPPSSCIGSLLRHGYELTKTTLCPPVGTQDSIFQANLPRVWKDTWQGSGQRQAGGGMQDLSMHHLHALPRHGSSPHLHVPSFCWLQAVPLTCEDFSFHAVETTGKNILVGERHQVCKRQSTPGWGLSARLLLLLLLQVLLCW